MNNIAPLIPRDTMQLVSIQYELLMAVGLDLKLETMLHIFMQKCMTRLGLRSVHIYTFPRYMYAKDTFVNKSVFIEHFSSIPQDNGFYPHNNNDIHDVMAKLYQEDIRSPVTIQSDNTNYIIFYIKKFGVLVLDKLNLPTHVVIPDAVAPIIERLAAACRACIEHENIASEIEARMYAEKAYEIQAKQDPLTRLSNRRIFQQRLFQEFSRSLRHKEFGSVLFIDLDHFKNINDSLGHTVGDALLTEVASRLRVQARAEDNIFRIGGDEFVLLLSNIGSSSEKAARVSQDVAERLCEQISRPITVKDQTLHITPSIGIVLFPGKEIDDSDIASHCEEVIQNADIALFRAKKHGRNRFEFYKKSMQTEAIKYHTIETHLRNVVHNNELTLVYQPLVDCNETIIGAEALLRWNNPELGMVSPDEFIPIAEETGQIIKIGEWVLRTACSFAKKIHLMPGSTLHYISVNISQKQFNNPGFTSKVKEIITESKIPPQFIRFEITESILISDIDVVISKMKELSMFGIEFLLDDFGTGYSSLSHIQRLPICTIKIDKTFISDINSQSDSNKAITNAIISLADHICLDCIAEGIETQEDAEYCKSKNIHAMQGYYYHRPLANENFIEVLISSSGNDKHKYAIQK